MCFDACTLNLAEFSVISAPFKLKILYEICVYEDDGWSCLVCLGFNRH